ncbi:MAG: zinc-binding dehydrogenase [Elusimicrobia bacterium]|nr:zinc-binding dehydrogenase [Elusimicrobiota bacterium]
MKAVYFKEFGGADKLIYGDRPTPKPGPDEILVQVKACALNHLDIWVRSGVFGPSIALPHIPGSDVSGIVEKAGDGVANVSPGQRVMVAPGVSCWKCEECLLGRDHLCPNYDIIGQKRDGGYAEYAVVPAVNAIPIPDKLSFEEAASFPLVFLTAWHLLVSLAGIKSGESVLIQAGGSGLGIAAIQIAKLWKAKVFTTVGTAAKGTKAKALGADEIIHYEKNDFLQEVRQRTNKRGVDVVLEHVGQTTFEKSLACLAPGGRMVICGATSGRQAAFDLRSLFSRNITIYGSRMGSLRDLHDALYHLNAGHLKPVVDKTFPLKRAAEAQTYMEERKNFGKIVLTV